MNASLATPASIPTREAGSRRSLPALLAPLDEIAENSSRFICKPAGRFGTADEDYTLPGYLFMGPKGGGDPIRVGLFAGIHGDEPEGVRALVQFVKMLDRLPEFATGYALHFYPVCNPTGYEDNTRHSRWSRKDLNREFWTGSSEPEVVLLEKELTAHSFHGIISLHTDDTSEGFYGYAHGATLTRNLIDPALVAAERFLPRNRLPVIDGFEASNGVIREGFSGILRGSPQMHPRPFEIILETPQTGAESLKQNAMIAALQTILVEYRKFISFASNL